MTHGAVADRVLAEVRERTDAELRALDTRYREGLAQCERRDLVTAHDAFGYLEKYGLHVASIVGL